MQKKDKQRVLVLGDGISYVGTYVSLLEFKNFQLAMDSDFEFLNLGLAAETTTGLSEPAYPFLRPCIHERIKRVLQVTQPDQIIMCYGMNDGIYQAPSRELVESFKQGMTNLINTIKNQSDANIHIMTPPIFEHKNTIAFGNEKQAYGYQFPHPDYNELLEQFADWLMTLALPNVCVSDLHLSMTNKKQALGNPALTIDGMSTNELGHLLIAEHLLEQLPSFLPFLGSNNPQVAEYCQPNQVSFFKNDNVSLKETQRLLANLHGNPLYQLVDQRRSLRTEGWIKYAGYEKETTVHSATIEPTEVAVAAMTRKIRDLRDRQASAI